MRGKITIGAFIMLSTTLIAQQNPTGSPVPNGYTTPQQAASAWYRGGNNFGNTAGLNNILGTMWNSPIYTVTNGVNRTKLNGNVNYTVNGYTGTRNGNMLIGNDGPLLTGAGNIYTAKGAFSLLHLNGPGSQVQELGYRPWMQTGITFTGNSDLSYFGLRKLSIIATQEDITETVILWSDNSGAAAGPDKLVFRFSGYQGTNGATVNADRLSNTDLDALHVAQFSGNGLMGLGNTFGTNATGMTAANYVDPQSLFHMSYDWRAVTVTL